MSDQPPRPAPGTIAWTDLTVPDADRVRDFYAAVTGWQPSPVAMGGYNDYCMMPPAPVPAATGAADSPGPAPAAGICHARGVNADIPPVWLVYIVVEDVARSVDECVRLGGSVIRPASQGPFGAMAIIRDPAGAACALYKPA